MRSYKKLQRVLLKPIEFILVLLITVLVSPLVLFVAILEVAEKLQQRSRRKQWTHKVRKSALRNRNNPVMWG